jgi:SAM-dependent methyltransferase
MEPDKTREPQYQRCLELRDSVGVARLGLMSGQTWHDDPKRLLFVMARYKFVAKMLAGSRRVLEVGAADAFASRIVQQDVGELTVIDFDPVFAADARERMEERWPFEYRVHDILEAPVAGEFDAAYSLDVLEHIVPEGERRFVGNIAASLAPQGVLIVGTPSLQSQAYASEASKEGHVNCKDHRALRELLGGYFHNVFLFSMNDEVVHTGFYPMAHYFLALCCAPKAAGERPSVTQEKVGP